MDVSWVGFNQKSEYVSILNVFEVESHFVLFVAKVDKKVQEGSLVINVLIVEENTFEDLFFCFKIVFSTGEMHYYNSIEFTYFFLIWKGQLQ